MARKTFLLLFASYVLLGSTVRAESIKNALEHRYKKQVLALRCPFADGDQEFDSSGRPLKTPSGGAWLVYGGIYVQKLNLGKDTLRLQGPRVAFTAASQNKKLPVVVQGGKPLRIEIHLDRPLGSPDEAEALLERIFYPGAKNSVYARPEYRRADNPRPAAGATEEKAAQEHIFGVGKDDVKAPEPIYTPEPSYNEVARQAKYSGVMTLGVIVDKTGTVSRIRIERATGMYLDEEAVNTVKTWRFKPATRNGEPVAAAMNVDVSFSIY